jgi:hypothetical protein
MTVIERPWQPPERVTADDVVGARRWLQAFSAEDGRVQDGVLKHWLFNLAAGLNHTMDPDALKLRINALAFSLAERPSFVFTADSLRDAQKTFAFVPTAYELLHWCEAYEQAERETARRLILIVDRGVRSPGDPDPSAASPAADRRERAPEELRAVGDICAGIRAKLKADAEAMERQARDRRKMGRYPDRPPEPTATVPEVPTEPFTEEST